MHHRQIPGSVRGREDIPRAALHELPVRLLLLTGVEKVCLDFGTPGEKQLDSMTVEEATKYIEEKQFSSGAMLPKVEAAVSFASSSPARKSIITSIDTALDGIMGKTGTVITC